jgi:hypothetical protein
MKKIFSFFESKRGLTGLVLLTGLVFTTYKIQENSNHIKRLANFESGIQTCFGRVNQTYMANLLGDTTSTYLTQNFQNLTEECLAEGILTVENSFQDQMLQATKQLSHLASNVHWFHEDILSPNSGKSLAGNGEGRDVASRFEKIESTKDEILESTTKYKELISSSLNQQKNVFYVSATLLVVLMMFEFLQSTRKKLSNNAREKEATDELANNGGATSVKVGEIIRVALEQNDLNNCAKLFANFHAYSVSDKGKNRISIETLVTPMGKNKAMFNETIDKIWADDSLGVIADQISPFESINLDKLCHSVVDLLAEKLFSQGVQLELHINENINVSARSEELEQVLYNLLAYSINSIGSQAGNKTISIYAHKLGDVVAFDLLHSGVGFDEAILKKRAGLNSIGGELDLDLKICQSLLDELQSKVQLDNKIDQNGNVVGGRVKIIFKGAPDSTPTAQTTPIQKSNGKQLVDLKVGSKKELMAAFNNTRATTI